MVCLLRVGFEDEEAADEAISAAMAERFGPYKIERREDGAFWELGRGAMGVTYRAIDTSLQRPVALKLIDPEWIKRGAEARERFMREARTAASLRHPNVATVYHFGIQEENGQFFCAIELVEGETLEMHVRRTGPLDPLTTVEIALQVSSALAAAEKHGVVHRDLKPANLMLIASAPDANTSRAGKADEAEIVVKVIDFGVAKALAEKPDAMDLTHGFVGTPAFASPEQFTDAPVDVRSDIYSLGATLWYLLTGNRPFQGKTIEQIRASQHSRALPIEQLKAARVPARLSSLLVSMLAPEPAARPSVRTLTAKLKECRVQLLDRWKAARRFALAAGLIGITATAFVLFFPRQTRLALQNAIPAIVSEKTIAVLPFESLSEDKSNAYFASGVRDEIVTKLAQVRGLKVVSRSSTAKNGSRPANLPALGRELGTESFLEGSVQKIADDLSIQVRLIDAKSGRQLWTQNYQQSRQAISEVEGEVAHQVAEALKVKLAPGEAQRLRLAATNNPRAHDSYLRARALSAYSDEKSHEGQIALLRDAVAEDPQYAVAWAELAAAYVHIGDAYRAPREILTPARDAAEKAVALDEKLAAGHMVLAGIALTYDWNFALAKREFERAITLDPDSSDAHRLYGWYLARAERNFVAARQEMAKAHALDPFYTWPLWAESSVAIAQGDHVGALRLAERVIQINPQFLYDEDPIAHVYVAMERWQDGVNRYESIPTERFNRPNFELAICYAHTGQIDRARGILVELETLAQQRYVDHTHLAGIHAALGDKDKAFAALDQALKDRSARVYASRFYPWLAPLKNDPRFLELENKIAHSQLPAPPESQAPERSIALLPFENLSDEKNDAFFADGIHEDILASLSKIADLKLTSRGSVQQYRHPEPAGRNLRVIATTLGVRNLLEGSVRRTGNRLLVKVQLTDALQDRLVWAERYDRSIADSITLQGELAMEIASALRARLSAEEQKSVAEKPTQNAEAYVLYLRGLEQKSGTATFKGLERLRMQERLFEQAVALDPDFALAHAQLSQTLAYIYHDFDPTEQTRQRARAASATALRLQPNLGEGHFADALCLYWTEKDYEGAVRGFAKAAQLLPNRAEVEAWGSFVRRRQGRWKEALEGFERALERDPRNKDVLSGYFATQYFLRDWAAARRASERAIAAASDTPTLMRIEKGYLSIWSAGDLVPLRESLVGVPTGVDPDGGVTLARWDSALLARDFAAAERAIVECRSETILANHGTPVPKGYFLGCVALARGDVEGARKFFEAARSGMEAEIKAAPLEPFRHAQLGLLNAFMKRKEDALREGNRAVELAPIEKDAIYGAQVLALLAVICAQTGEHDRALELIQRLLVTPAAVLPAFEGSITLHELGLRWHWDPLRGDSRFKQILAGSEPATNYLARPAEQPIAVPEKSIAVLPFENRSEDKENAFFADAMQDDVLTSLVKIKELKVIGRASVMSYRDGTKRNLRDIGRELGVAHVLEGTVRRVADRMLIHVNLTDTRDGRAVWAERYDRTLADFTRLQGELAIEIASALRMKLAPETKASLELKSTENPDAYVFYLRGRDYQMRPETSQDNFLAAENFYKQAITLDPRFALARARLAVIENNLYGFFDHRPARIAEARSNAEEAVRLDPNCGQAHMALAVVTIASGGSPEEIKREIATAVRLLPNDAYIAMDAAMYQQHMNWATEATASYERAIVLNPREGKTFYNYGVFLYEQNEIPRARWALDRALELSPESVYFRVLRAKAEIEWTGDVTRGKAILAGLPKGKDPDGRVTAARCTIAVWERNFSEALKLLDDCPVDRIPGLDMGFGLMTPKNIIRGLVQVYAGDRKGAYTTLDSARWMLEVEAREKAGDTDAHFLVALTYADMGWKDAAKAEAARSKEKLDDYRTAFLLAHLGEVEPALTALERAALTPEFRHVYLRLEPDWDSVREHPRFQKLLAQAHAAASDAPKKQ